MSSPYDSIFFPTMGLSDDKLVKLLKKVRLRVIKYGHGLVRMAYLLGDELERKGHTALLSKNPDLWVQDLNQNVKRMDCLIKTGDLKKWLKAIKKPDKVQRKHAVALMYVEVLKKHPTERDSKIE